MIQKGKNVTWKDSYLLGHDQVDIQHKQIFKLADALNPAYTEGGGKRNLLEALRFLEVYTIQHFYFEEELQRRYGFPDYERHKKLHNAFTMKVSELKAGLDEDSSTLEVRKKTHDFLISWLVNHVQEEDKKIGEYIKISTLASRRNSVLIVDDDTTIIQYMSNILSNAYTIYTATNGLEGIEVVKEYEPDLIMLDINMPKMSGYEMLSTLKNSETTKEIPVVLITGADDIDSESKGFDLGAADFIKKPPSPPMLLKRIENQLTIVRKTKDLRESRAEVFRYADNLERMMCEKVEEVFSLQNAVMHTIADLVEFRDGSTGGHISRTRLFLKALVEKLVHSDAYADELSGWNMYFFLQSAQLHDVGKIAISDTILNKPDKLTHEEFEIMKSHVMAGADAIERIMGETQKNAFLDHALLIASTHHEKWDGTGYPLGLKGTDIPLEGRLMAIADVYDALTTVRPYKEAFSHEKACEIIEEGSGTHFDPMLVDVFGMVKEKFAQIAVGSEDET